MALNGWRVGTQNNSVEELNFCERVDYDEEKKGLQL
jgi:hypothetical protein